MPTLNWIGKEAVINHHNEVPLHLLRCDEKLSVGDASSGNMLVHGDNLLALKALLPYYAGQVKCVYIDPPYNTGNEGWAYNDNVNSPEMRQWLGQVVGKEAEDLSRHDKWLCMMYPRLMLLKELLSEEGSLWMSIDDNEVQHARSLLDDVLGANNFVATVVWEKAYAPKSSAIHLSERHDFVLVYAKRKDKWRRNLLPRTEQQDQNYKNPDNDPRGLWRPNNLAARNYYSKGTYSIRCPGGRFIEGPPKGSYWRISEERLWEWDSEDRIWWGHDGNNVPAPKIFLSEVQQGVVPETIWFYSEVGHTQEAKKELIQICEFDDSSDVFITPKPTRLIKRILQIATGPNDIVLDSFAGTGTTGQAVLQQNQTDGGQRRFILVEMDDNVIRDVTIQRLQRVIEGYDHRGNERTELLREKLTVTSVRRSDKLFTQIDELKQARGDDFDKFETKVENEHLVLYGVKRINGFKAGLGGGFRFCHLGQTLFDADSQIREDVTYAELARYTYFLATGAPLPGEPLAPPLVGIDSGIAVYLLYNGVLRDKTPQGGNALTRPVLAALPNHVGPKIVYGTSCRLGDARLETEQITFRQIPYQLFRDT